MVRFAMALTPLLLCLMLPARTGRRQPDTCQEPRAGFRLKGYQKARGGLVVDAASYAGVGIATRKWKRAPVASLKAPAPAGFLP